MGITLAKTPVPAPVTYAGSTPTELVGLTVAVRPYYLTLDRHSTRSARTVQARVIDTFGAEMVIVEHTRTQGVPWQQRQAYYPHELHHAYFACLCPACAGDGIHTHHGA